MKKAVLKLNLHDDKTKQKAMKTVSGIEGVNSVTMDMKDQKLTVTGDIDPVIVVRKLRKFCVTEIISVEAEKKEEAKKEEPKKPEEKKDELAQLVKAYQAYHTPPMAYTAYYAPPMNSYYVRSSEEDHNACVIC